MDTIKLTRKQAKEIIQATFPNYSGRKIKLEFANKVTFYDLNWDGGTHNEYRFLNADGRTAELPRAAPWNNGIEGETRALPVNILVVCRSYFCGHDMGLTIIAHPDNLANLKTLTEGETK